MMSNSWLRIGHHLSLLSLSNQYDLIVNTAEDYYLLCDYFSCSKKLSQLSKVQKIIIILTSSLYVRFRSRRIGFAFDAVDFVDRLDFGIKFNCCFT